jgi:hypothetical protein
LTSGWADWKLSRVWVRALPSAGEDCQPDRIADPLAPVVPPEAPALPEASAPALALAPAEPEAPALDSLEAEGLVAPEAAALAAVLAPVLAPELAAVLAPGLFPEDEQADTISAVVMVAATNRRIASPPVFAQGRAPARMHRAPDRVAAALRRPVISRAKA